MTIGKSITYLVVLYFFVQENLVEANSSFVGRDCLDLLHQGYNLSGLYNIDPDGEGAFPVLCDQETNGGGWLVIQKRLNGGIDFNKNWNEYKEGFGNLSTEFWLGNEKIHRLSSMNQQLLIEIEDFNGSKAHASYKEFSVDSETEKYKLVVTGYSGTAGNSLENNQFFSTIDQDNDPHTTYHCAQKFGGGWWYKMCGSSCLNGNNVPSLKLGMVWNNWKGQNHALKRTAMKIRTLRERPWDYYLSFTGAQSQDFASIPVVLNFQALTVSWWMRGSAVPATQWSAVFSLVNIPQAKKIGFSYTGDRRCKITSENETWEIDSEHRFADSEWHHMLLAWDVQNGDLRFHVDTNIVFDGQTANYSDPFPGGALILGQSQNTSGGINGSESLKADIMHFNMWEHMFTEQETIDIYSECSVQIGTLVPWPEMQVALPGNVTRIPYVRCLPQAEYDWPLTKSTGLKLQEQLKSREGSFNNNAGTGLGVLTRNLNGRARLGSYTGTCVDNLDNCNNGLSFSFWMNYNVPFTSRIIGLNSKYHNALRTWLEPLMPKNARWPRCYRAADDGFLAQTFHAKCGTYGATVTFVKVGRFVFGGFSDQRWGGTSSPTQDLWSSRSFLFSIVNPAGLEPVKLVLKPNKMGKALRQDPLLGPVFGESDLHIGNNADQSETSFSNLGHAYELPNNSFDARKFLAGSYHFIVDDIEVFYYAVTRLTVGNGQMTLSASNTYQDTQYAPYRARSTSTFPWCTNYDGQSTWWSVDLGTLQSVSKIELVKIDTDSGYVLTYKVSYKDTGYTWITYSQNGSQVFDGQNPVMVSIPPSRHIRLHPKTWHNEICMRVNLYKIDNGVLTELGVNDSSVIPDSSFTAMSYKCMSGVDLAYPASNRKCYGAWCGQGSSTYLQIRFNWKMWLAFLNTKGPISGNPVKSFYLAYSLDGTTWNDYTQGGIRLKLYGNWYNEWVRNSFHPPLYTKFLRILPQQCHPYCCMNIQVTYLKQGLTDHIIASGAEVSGGEGFALYHDYLGSDDTSSYHLAFATSTKRWSIKIPAVPLRWVHVTVTWSEVWGLKYYEDGRLVKEGVNFKMIDSNDVTDEIHIGDAPSHSISYSYPLPLQMSDLVFWHAFLSEAVVKDEYSLSDNNRIWSYEQPLMDFEWHSQINCTDANHIGPCSGGLKKFMYIESSFPRVKGEKARLETRWTIPTRNCFTFWYYMHGDMTGRLNVYTRTHSNNVEILMWRLAGSHGNVWRKAQIPIKAIYTYQVIIEGLIGSYHGDIAISGAVLSVNENCSFTPNEARVFPDASECRDPLGMASGAIPDERISASSWRNDVKVAPASRGRLHIKKSGKWQGCWRAATAVAGEWLQIDLGNQYKRVTRVASQGRCCWSHWVKSYKLQYSNNVTFQYYREHGQIVDKVFTGNTDRSTVVSHDLNPPIIARYIRFRPISWHSHIAMRVELYGCQECHNAIGMESGAIPDSQISASSEWDVNHAAKQGRLNFQKTGNKMGAWSALTKDAIQWLQVDVGSYCAKISRVATQGRNGVHQWVTRYHLQYGNNGVNFRYYREQGKTANKDFAGNTDRDSVVSHDLNPPIKARFIRFRIVAWYGHISMRVELYGCPECRDALGMESELIADGQISASTEHAICAPKQGRLNFEPLPGIAGCWCPQIKDANQWLQIHFGSQSAKITRVGTQGRSDKPQWVTSYVLQYSNTGDYFRDYRKPYQSHQEFVGNTDQHTVVSHDLNPPITARYVRFVPKKWNGYISMRAELYGCQDIVCELPCMPGQYCDDVTGQCVCDSSLRDEEWCRKRQRYVPLPIDKLIESAAFYWTMDDDKKIYNMLGSDFGFIPREVNTINGIRNKALNIENGITGTFTLTEGLDPSECLFDTNNCNEGFTLMLWLWYKHNTSGQVFLASNGDSYRGLKMFQIISHTPQVGYQITTSNKRCVVVFSTPKEVWTHYILTYMTLDDLNSVSVYVNGEQVTDFVYKGCSGGSYAANNITTQFFVGDVNGDLPEAAFDEVIIWYRNLTSEEIATAYDYYKGGPNLQLLVELEVQGSMWNERLLDPETQAFKVWSRQIANHIQSLYHNTSNEVAVTIEKYWDVSGEVGCKFIVKFNDTGYSAVKPVIDDLSQGANRINKLEANDIFITAVSLQAHNDSKQQSIELSITWHGPTQLSHGIFQGYEIFYHDTNLGQDFNVSLRTNETFYEIHGLQPYTLYVITARSFTLEGEGRMSEPIYVWTQPKAPIHFPTNITAFNKSSSSLQVTWVSIPTQQGIGQVTGYIVVYFAVKDGNSTTQNVSVTSGNLNETILVSLQKFSNYSIQVLGFTKVDMLGPLSDPFYAMTDQDVPSLPPSNVTGQGINSSSILVSWGPVPSEGRHGIITGYGVVFTRQDASPLNWTQQTCNNMSWCEITGLDTYTRYYIAVRGMTVKGFGTRAYIEAWTQKGVSVQPPSNLTAHNTSSTSILITWNVVPPNEIYVKTYAYDVAIVQAQQANGTSEDYVILGACVNATNMTLHQTNLLKYTAYNVTVRGVTVQGFGKTSDQITVFTDEDIPEGSPQNITPAETSSTSLTLAWEPLTNNIANGLILGYHILLLDKLRNATQNITVQSLDQANIENLFPYTVYEARIVPFNSKGQGNASDVILVRTKEAAPSRPPSNFTGQAPSSTKVALHWKPVDELHVNGILRAYVIFYFVTHSPDITRHNISIPVTSTRKRRAISDLSSPSYELSGLKKFTEYTIEVMAYTVDYGVPSHEINITTAQDVPSHSPINVTAFNTSSTSINVTWDPVPDDHLNGIIMGYRVFYKKADEPMDDFSNITVNSSVFDVEINDLEFFTKYEIQALAFTVVGDGNISEPLFCMTDEDVPEGAPVNLSSLPANTTVLTVNWLPVIEEDRNGIILGYWVSLSNSTGEFIRNVSVLGSEALTVNLGGLEVWTNYTFQVCAFTVKGNGPWSGIVQGITDEEAPRIAPTNITAFNTSSTSLHVTWQPISTIGLRGILRAYRVYYIEQETYFTRSLRNVTVDSATLEVELEDLYKFTNYTVYVVARTNKDGVSSEKVNASTDEDKPDKSPANLDVWTPHSSALHISWNEVPNGYKNGIIRGYKVQYTELNDNGSTNIEDIQPWKQSLRITGLRKFTLYNVTVLAYTSKGDGMWSSQVFMTDQDVPDTPPLNIQAESIWTTHTIPLRWTHIPTYLLNGILTGYRIRYQAIEMGDLPYEENPREVILPPENTSTVLTELESFAVYRIEVTGLTAKGDGPSEVIFAETCRCVKRLTTNWMVLEPYVSKDSSTKHGLGGLMTRFVDDMAVTCCQSCRTHGHSYVDFEFNGKDEPARQPTEEMHRLNIDHDTDLSFPVYGYKLQDRFRHEFGYTGIIESPGIAYVINTKFGNQVDTSLLDAVLASWPLLLIGALLAYIFGFIIWAVDQVQNSEHFPCSFIPGMWEGFWWAYVSMTTVGYGDRTPLSNPARLVAIVWTLAGVVIIGILVGFIAVSLTTISVGVDYKLYGAQVAAIHGSAQYNMGVRKNAKLDSSQVFRTFEEIYELLSSNQIGGVLIDGYMVGGKKELFEKPYLRIYKVYDYSSVYGVVTGGDSRKLGKCFQSYMQENIATIFEHVAKNVKAIQESPEPLEVERSTGLFDTDSELFKKNLMMLVVLLGCGILAGTVWEIMYRVRKKMKIQPQESKPVIPPSSEMSEMLQEYKSRMYNLIAELKEKHRLQRRSILSAMKNNHKYRYAQKETVSANSQRISCEEDDLTKGIVALPVLRKALTEREEERTIYNRNQVRVSFHVPDEKDDKDAEEHFEMWEGLSPEGAHSTTGHTPSTQMSQTSFA